MRFRLRSLLFFTAAVAVALTAYRWWPMDGVIVNLLAFGGDDTVWGKAYTDENWRAVRVGMKRDEVYSLLGRPLEVRQNRKMFDFDTLRQHPGEVVECWTCTPKNSHYHVRQIVFSGDTVVDKLNEFYFD